MAQKSIDNGTYRTRILTCAGTGCIASDSTGVMRALEKEINDRELGREIDLVRTGCRGFCAMGPLMLIYPAGIFYCLVQPDDVPEIIQKTIIEGQIIDRLIYRQYDNEPGYPYFEDIPFYKRQLRIVLRNCGFIDPERIDDYVANGGYNALRQAINTLTPPQVIDVIKRSGLCGRGGAGFLTGQKWEYAANALGSPKYVICNADEGDPGAFMDRSVLEGDPHAVIEGMLIAAYATGASHGYVYCRAEYPLALARLEKAIEQAQQHGFLGANILGTDFDFDVQIKQGAGAFVCGEETALIASIEGRRGMPRTRPPFPANEGLFGKPTTLNNVETLANVPHIILNGPDWFASIGKAPSTGTKVFALAGKVNRTGLIEVPLGTTLREVVYDIGGGIPDGRQFKAAQTGGPSGGCIPAELIDIPLDYESLAKAGSIVGSGGLIIMDDSTCMVDIARYFLDFTQRESCGKCVPCRLGTRHMLDILESICAGKGKLEDLDTLEEISATVQQGSLCALGQTAPNPVISMLRYFRDEYLAHIVDHRCPSKKCISLLKYVIDPVKCVGCGVCAIVCPSNAISGEKKQAHTIEQSNCSKCGTCLAKCRFEAISC